MKKIAIIALILAPMVFAETKIVMSCQKIEPTGPNRYSYTGFANCFCEGKGLTKNIVAEGKCPNQIVYFPQTDTWKKW